MTTSTAAPNTATPAVSVALPPSDRLVEYAQVADRLGYERLWVYDSPALYGDLWISLSLIAGATERIGLGAGVAVPSLRHPMVTASAISTIEQLAPGRLIAAFGTGFSARMAMGKKAMRWADLGLYVTQLRALLAGDVIEIDGHACQMLHAPGWGPSRPISTPIWVAPAGPKGFATAHEVGAAGVMLIGTPPEGERDWAASAMIVSGTVIRPGEDHTTPRVVEAAGPWFATGYHAIWEFNSEMLGLMPGGDIWLAGMEAARPATERHLAVHEGHVTVMTDRDRAAIAAAGPAIVQSGWTGDSASIRTRLSDAAGAGVGEIVYTPAGPDIVGELEAFIDASRG